VRCVQIWLIPARAECSATFGTRPSLDPYEGWLCCKLAADRQSVCEVADLLAGDAHAREIMPDHLPSLLQAQVPHVDLLA